MKKQISQVALVALFITTTVPNLALAAWWNPLSWRWFQRPVITEVIQVATSTIPDMTVFSTTATSTGITEAKIKRITSVTNSSKEENDQKIAEAFRLIAEQNALIKKQKEQLSINNSVKTQDKSLCIKINTMIANGIIPPNKVNSARAAAGCKTIITMVSDEEEVIETPITRPRITNASNSIYNNSIINHGEEDTPDTVTTTDEEGVPDQIDQDEDEDYIPPTITPVIESRYSDYNFEYNWWWNNGVSMLSCSPTSRNIVIREAVFKLSNDDLQKLTKLKELEDNDWKYANNLSFSVSNRVYILEKNGESKYKYIGNSIPLTCSDRAGAVSLCGSLSSLGGNAEVYLNSKGLDNQDGEICVNLEPVMSEWKIFDNTQGKPVEIK